MALRRYHTARLFDEKGVFTSEDLDRSVALGRRHFFVYFPKHSHLEEVGNLRKWLARHPEVRFCVHDLNVLHPDNEYALGRNMAFYTMLNRGSPHLESVSYHLGSLFGFGVAKQAELIQEILALNLPTDLERERFYCAAYDMGTYRQWVQKCFEQVGSMARIAKQAGFRILVKNLCYDYVITPPDSAAAFLERGYRGEALPGGALLWPIPCEKGDFPRTARELLRLAGTYDVGIALDLEFFRHLALASRKFHLQDEHQRGRWDLRPGLSGDEFVESHGFWVENGKPVFYEKPIDLYDELFALKGKVTIAHLSASPGLVFPDSPSLSKTELTDEMLLGLGPEDMRASLIPGRRPQGVLDGVDEKTGRANFQSAEAQREWTALFKKQFSEDLFLLKEIGCEKVVLKMRDANEKAVRTFEMFDTLTELDLDVETEAAARMRRDDGV